MDAYQLRQGAGIEFLHDLGAMYLNGAFTDAQLARDHLVGQTFRDQHKYFMFTFG